MTRVTLAALAGAAVLFAGTAIAQQNVDFSKVEIKTTDLGHNTYMLQGQGGNITVAVGTDGIIMVDSEFAPLHDKIKAAIAKISPLPIKYLINTHYHGDHTGGNAPFHKDGATVVAQDNIRLRLAAGSAPNGLTGAKTVPQPADGLPTDTYCCGSKTVEVGGQKALLTHVYNAHTDGDTWVYFDAANVLDTGDTFTNTGRYNTIDFANGGDIRGLIRAVNAYSSGVERPDQGRTRPWGPRQKGGPGCLARYVGNLTRSNPKTGRRRPQRAAGSCREAVGRSRQEVGRKRSAGSKLAPHGLQLVQALVIFGTTNVSHRRRSPTIPRGGQRLRDLCRPLLRRSGLGPRSRPW